jgi:hypothetical protein
MSDAGSSDAALWTATVERARRELAALPIGELDWLAAQVDRIGHLQETLARLFREVGGPATCAGCHGGCCGHARHHATLTNLLGYLLAGREPPRPDFTRTCPFLDERGCRLPVPHRPFNCIIFLCEELDQRLTEPQRQAFGRAESALRAAYTALADHCPGASLRGLLVTAARIGDRPLLTRAA